MFHWLSNTAGRRRFRITIYAFLAGLVAWLVLDLFLPFPFGEPARMDLAGKATPNANVLVEVNDKPSGAVVLSEQAGIKSLELGHRPIKKLKLSIEGDPGTRISVSGLYISYGSEQVSHKEAGTLSSLKQKNLSGIRFDNQGLTGVLNGSEASLEDSPKPALVAPGTIGNVKQWLVGTGRAPAVLNFWSVMLLLGIVAVVMGVGRGRLFAVAAGVGVWMLAIVSYAVVPDIVNPDPPVAVAVGAASFYGQPYAGQQIAAWACFFVILVGSIWLRFYLLRRSSQESTRDAGSAAPAATAAGRVSGRARWSKRLSSTDVRGLLIVVIGWMVLSLTLVTTIGGPPSDPVSPSWDAGNLTAWRFFLHAGLVPMDDFWFPYGNQWLFGFIPTGTIWKWLADVLMLAILAWSLWRLSGRRPMQVLICLFAIAMFSTLGFSVWRYMPAVLVGISYAALGAARHRVPSWGHLVFFVACFIAVFLGVDQLIIGLAGVCLVVFGELLFGRLPIWSLRTIRGLVVDVVPVLAAGLSILIFWLAMGNVSGNLSFLLNLNDVVAYVGVAQKADGMLASHLFTNMFITTLPFLLLFAGLAQGFLGRRSTSRAVSSLLLAAAGSSMMLLHRGLARPGAAVTMIALFALTFAAVLLWDSRARLSSILTGAFFGSVVFAVQLGGGGLQEYLTTASGSRTRALKTAGQLTDYMKHGEKVRYYKERTFEMERYADWPEVQMADELRSVLGSSKPSFAVLGDAPMLYVWFKTRPPYHINLYDSAPIRQQQKVVDSLRRRKPQYIIWQRGMQIDLVPYVIRDPMIFTYIIGRYVPVRRGDFDILKRRRPGQPMPINYWRTRLGTSLDLWYIPSYAKLPAKRPCSEKAKCVSYAVIRGQPAGDGNPIELEIAGRGKKYRVLAKTRSGEDHYTIRLDRLWFWQLLGSQPRITLLTPTMSLKLMETAEDGRLY